MIDIESTESQGMFKRMLDQAKQSPDKLDASVEFDDIADIRFEYINGESKDSADVTLYCDSNDSSIEERVKSQLVDTNWWLQDRWREQGLPHEQLTIHVGDRNIDLYNFGQTLSEEQRTQLLTMIQIFSQIQDGEVLNQVRYLLVSNQDETNPYTGEAFNGYGVVRDSAIKLFPAAFETKPHRVSAASNFEGTIIHELSHCIVEPIENAWIKKFGWKYISEGRKTPGGFVVYRESEDPSRCVTDYATHSPGEDIAESMVAAIKSPETLDPEKLAWLRENVLPSKIVDEPLMADIKVGSDIELPRLQQPVKVKIMKPIVFVVSKS